MSRLDAVIVSAGTTGRYAVADKAQPARVGIVVRTKNRPWFLRRALRDIAAKRAIVAAYLPDGGDPHPGLPCINYEGQDPANYSEWDTCSRHIKASERRIHHDYVIRLLASAWSDHPDCDPAWAV